MTTDTLAEIETVEADALKPRQRRVSKRSAAADPVQGVIRALEVIEKIQEQNVKASSALDDLGSVWLSAAATRRRAEAAIALSHFDGALDTLRKTLESLPS